LVTKATIFVPKKKKLSMTVGLNPQLSKLTINEWFGIGRLACPIVGESEPSPKLVPF
jgi:hypothetical protein